MFGSGDNLEGVITSDHLPLQGHRHFPDKASHDLLQQWLKQAAGRGSPLPIDVCMQMFARYNQGVERTKGETLFPMFVSSG